MADGSKPRPFTDLKTALTNPALKPGHTIYLRAGTHILRGDTDVTAPNITIRPYANEDAVIELATADLLLNSRGLTLRDITILSSDPRRSATQATPNSPDIPAGELSITGTISMMNTRIRGVKNMGWWTGSAGIWNGVLVQDTGWDTPNESGGYGHTLYIQNSASDGAKTLRACILVPGYGWTLHGYGSSVASLEDMHFTDCALISGGVLVGGEKNSSVNAVTFTNCLIYSGLRMGYVTAPNRAASITGTALMHLHAKARWESLTVTGCVFLSGDDDCISPTADNDFTAFHFDDNVYISSKARPLKIDGEGWFTLAEWRARTGLDANSRHYTTVQDAVTAGDLTVPIVRVFPVNEGAHVANIAIWNPLEDATVSVDLSALGMANGAYELRQVRDYTGDVRPVTYTGAAVDVSMSGTTEWPPGYPTAYHPEAVPANALPVFGAFELWMA